MMGNLLGFVEYLEDTYGRDNLGLVSIAQGANLLSGGTVPYEEYNETIKTKLLNDIEIIINDKQLKAEFIISGKKVSTLKKERYKTRVQASAIFVDSNSSIEDKNSSSIILYPLATAYNLGVEEYALEVLRVNKEWNQALGVFHSLIDTFENKVQELIKLNLLDKAEKVIKIAKRLGIPDNNDTPTPEEVIDSVYQETLSILESYKV